MATHSNTLVWKIPWTEEPGRLQSMGSLRVRHDRATSLSLFTFMHWRKKWHPTPVLLPGESQGRGSLVGCRLWGLTESDTTEATQQQQQHSQSLPIFLELFFFSYSFVDVLPVFCIPVSLSIIFIEKICTESVYFHSFLKKIYIYFYLFI